MLRAMADDIIGPSSSFFVSQRLRIHYVDWGNHEAPLLVLLPGADGWGGAVVCPTGKPCQICNCIRTRIFDPCNPHAVERFSGQPFGGCSRECQGM